MKGIRKEFDQGVHDACDPPARDAVARMIKAHWGLDAVAYEKYKVDLVVENEFMVPVGYAEVEMRPWVDCPFPTIHVPERKKKLFDNDLPTRYFVVSKDLKKAWWCKVEEILSSPLVEVKNKEVPEGEYFYDVPKKLWRQIRDKG